MFKRPLKIVPFDYIYQLTRFGDLMSCGLKDIFKNAPSRVLILVITSQIWWIMGCFKIKYNFSTKWTNFYHIRWHISEKILFISEGNLSFQNLGRHNLVNKNYNTHTCPITHEVKTTRQTQSVNRIKNIYFSSKIIQKMRQED